MSELRKLGVVETLPDGTQVIGNVNEVKLCIPLWRGVTSEGELIYGFPTCIGQDNSFQSWQIHEYNNPANSHYVIPESLAMQTGLGDIYGSMPGTRGGDILSESPDCNGEALTGEVVYNTEESSFQVNVLYEDGSVMPECLYELNNYTKIIGSAYLNPELLEVCDAK